MTTPSWMAALVLALCGCSSDFSVTKAGDRLVVSPALSDAGTIAVGDTVDLSFELSAIGGDVRVVSIDVRNVDGSWFELVGDDLPTVAGDGQSEVVVRYAPEEGGRHYARVTIETDEAQSPTHRVEVRGEAGEPEVAVWPRVLDFGPVRAMETGTGDVFVCNEGRVDVAVTAASVDEAAFVVMTPFPLDAPAGETVDLAVRFAPLDDDEATATLEVELSGGLEPAQVELRGNACSTGGGALYDSDSDGYGYCGSDCDDSSDDVHPGAAETCNDIDDDCDGEVDEDTLCSDDDGDGFSEEQGDCNDGDAAVNPSVTEDYGNGVDDDCDGVTDYGEGDADGDGYTRYAGDCDDADPDARPGGTETADGKDNDCDGKTDEGTSACDDDGDGYSEDDGDCDDTDPRDYPGASEREDRVDNDCDGDVDEGTRYADDDGDGFTETGGDCDDSDAGANPGEPETDGDGVDNDCDGTVE